MSHSDVHCAYCGVPVSANARFCRECGRPIQGADTPSAATPSAAPTPPAAAIRPTCPHCGSNISANAQFCRECGKAIADSAPSAQTATPGAVARGRGSKVGALIASGGLAIVCLCLAVCLAANAGIRRTG